LQAKLAVHPAGSLPFHYEQWKEPSTHKSSKAKEGWACQGQFHQSVKPLAGFLTLAPTGFGKLNFPPIISQEAVPVLHIKNYALSSRIYMSLLSLH
jgi:hypothetical protein